MSARWRPPAGPRGYARAGQGMVESADGIDEDRRREFEAAWAAGERPQIEAFLPAADDPRYAGTLEELVQIELELRWKESAAHGAPRVEDYLRRFPPLAEPQTLLRLIEQEYRVRHRYGDRPPRDEYRDRFPEVVSSATAIAAQPLQPEPPAARTAGAGERLGRYLLIDEHARGGFGSVWRARDELFGREVAIKQLSGPLAARAEFRRRFLTEARVTARLEHPGIVPVYDMGETGDGLAYYAMKLVHGRTLAAAIEDLHRGDGGISEPAIERRRLLNAFLFVCQTMEYAHARGVAHRDLKPQNIVLSDYGETVVLDWGLAKVAGETLPEPTAAGACAPPTATRPGTVQGTPAYMSPEQAAGRVGEVDERSDVYSLGVILYQLLTGRVPFEGDTSAAVLARVVEGRPRRPRAVADVPVPLESICLRAMAASRADRYPAVAALTRDLQRYLADEPVSAHVESARERLARFVRRRRAMVAGLTAAMFVVLVALLVLTLVLSDANERERRVRARAESNFALARDAVARYFLRVSQDPRLRAVGLARLRRDLLEAAGDFYRRFAEQRGDDPGVRKERALALRQLGLITEETRSPEAALERHRESGRMLAELVAQYPDDAGYRHALADHHNVLGNALKELNRYADAEASYRRALELFATVPASDAEADRAAVLNNLAITCENTGRMAEAEQYYGRALETHAAIAARDGEPECKAKVARTLLNLGMLLLRTDRPQQAEAHDRRALAICDEVIAAQPDEPAHPHLRATLHHNLAVAVRRLGRSDEARELYGVALAARRELAATHAGVPGYLHELAATLGNLAVVHFDAEEYERARELLTEALELRVKLRGMQPDLSVHEYDLAGIHINLGNILNREQKWTEAQAAFTAARQIDESLAERFPDELSYLYDAGAASFMMAIAVYNGGLAADAGPHYARASMWFEKVLERAPDYSGARAQLAVCTKYRAELEDELGHHAEAAALWSRAIELGAAADRDAFSYQRALSLGRAGEFAPAAELARQWQEGAQGERAFQAAILLVVAANAAARDGSAAAAEQVDRCAEAAIALLERALASGVFADPQMRAILEREPELGVLRARPAFRALLERLDK